MSEAFFDRLAKGMSGGTSRRGALKTLGGLLAGGFLFGLTGRAKGEDDGEERRDRICREVCEDCSRRSRRRCIEACEERLERDPDARLCASCRCDRVDIDECDEDEVCCDGRCRRRRKET